jgi:hypothetical protein
MEALVNGHQSKRQQYEDDDMDIRRRIDGKKVLSVAMREAGKGGC